MNIVRVKVFVTNMSSITLTCEIKALIIRVWYWTGFNIGPNVLERNFKYAVVGIEPEFTQLRDRGL